MSAHGSPVPALLLILLATLSVAVTAKGEDESKAAEERTHIRVRRQLAVSNNTIELLLVADRQAFSKYLARNGNNNTAALNELLRYVAGLVREVNERLAKISDNGVTLRVNLAELIVFSTAGESSATESNIVSGDTVNADAALVAFAPQVLALASNVSFDYAVLLSGYNLTRPDGSDADVRTFSGQMCGIARQGILENFCLERTALALTKGIALSMGAQTDGVGNSCPDQFFVQSFAFNVPPREFRGNPFDFSNCSADELAAFLNDNARSSCLRTQSVANPVDTATLAATELGQTYNADSQCEMGFGNGSTFCRGLYGLGPNFTFVDDLCRDMRCSIPGANTCEGTLPFDGTSCGISQWCQDGFCVADPNAPATVSSTCPQGDQPDATCLVSLCQVAGALYREYLCCFTCASAVTTTQASPGTMSIVRSETPLVTVTASLVASTSERTGGTSVSVPPPTTSGTTPAEPTAPGTTMSMVGTTAENTALTEPQTTMSAVVTTSENTGPSAAETTLSATAGTTAENTGQTAPGTSMSVVGTATENTGPTVPDTTMSIVGTATENTGPTVPDTTMSIVGTATENTGPTVPDTTMSIVGTATENTGPTVPDTTMSIVGTATENTGSTVPDTTMTATGSTGPDTTMSVAGTVTENTGSTSPEMTLSVAGTATENTGSTEPDTTMSVAGTVTENTESTSPETTLSVAGTVTEETSTDSTLSVAVPGTETTVTASLAVDTTRTSLSIAQSATTKSSFHSLVGNPG